MGESTVKLPSKSVVVALFKKHGEVKEKTASIGGDWSQQLQRHVENGNLHRAAFGQASAIVRKAGNNELAALEYLDHLRVYLDWAEEHIRARGHVGDLASQAQEAAKDAAKPAGDALSPDQALKAFEANAHKAPQPETAAEPVKKKPGRPKKAAAAPEGEKDSVEAFRETLRKDNAKGDKHIKDVADKLVAEQNKRLGPVEDPDAPPNPDAFDELDPPPAPTAAPPDTGKKAAKAQGGYRILN